MWSKCGKCHNSSLVSDHGYITGYSGDAPHVGPFQYRLLGFQKPPTDLYTRPFYQRSRQHLRGGKDYCLGSMNIAQHQFKYIRDVFDTFPEKLKFLFSYNGKRPTCMRVEKREFTWEFHQLSCPGQTRTRLAWELTSESLRESFVNSHVLIKREQELRESWQARVYMRVSSTLMSWSNENKTCMRVDKREFTWEFHQLSCSGQTRTRIAWELTSESFHKSFINSHVLVKREQDLHESWQARVCVRVSSTFIAWSNENKNCMRVDKREFTWEFHQLSCPGQTRTRVAWELTSESLRESSINSHVLVKREQNKREFALKQPNIHFLVLFSHDDFNEVEKIEPDLLSLVRDLNTRAQLNNTLLIVMGDHGSRFGFMRREIQGKLEERLPLFGMVFPPWFSEKYPKLYENLRVNTDRLTSWYDLHATFRHMLSYPDLPSNIKHGQSLLLEVPASRTCAQANIAPHWCPCQEWSAVDTMDSHVQNAAQAVVEFMNSLNGEHEMSRKFCEILNLKTVIYAAMEEPNEKVLTFHQTNDLRPAFQARARPVQKDICRYQIQLETSPNNGIYEATVKFHLGWFIVSKIVSRVNAYDQQPDCIAKTLPHLRKFCFCNVERNATNSSG